MRDQPKRTIGSINSATIISRNESEPNSTAAQVFESTLVLKLQTNILRILFAQSALAKL